MKTTVKILLSSILLCLAACTSDSDLNPKTGKKNIITFTVDKFISSNTRTTVDPAKSYNVTWATGDTIGIFPFEGYQEPFLIPTDQVGSSSASFDGGYWDVKNGLKYNAYYPFDKANFESAESKTTIPVSYLNQRQTGTTCCAGAFDYTYSDWTTAKEGNVNFKFHHLGAFYVLSLKLPATTTYTSLTIQANSEIIPTTGFYDLTASEPTFVAKTTATSLVMDLEDYSGTADETAVFYLMMPPVDLSSVLLTAILSTGSESCTYTLPTQDILAAHLYKVNGTPKESNISGTIGGWDNLIVNKHEFVNLGLPSGTLWATCNLGASKPEKNGKYYAWGETKAYNEKDETNEHNYKYAESYTKKEFRWATYKYCSGNTNNTLTKYNTSNKYGTVVDELTELELEDDAAYTTWGAGCRIPSYDQMDELLSNCYWVWTTDYDGTGVKGCIVYRRLSEDTTTPSASNARTSSCDESYDLTCAHIFLPAAGGRSEDLPSNAGSWGDYWTRTLYENPRSAYELGFYSSSSGTNGSNRCYGRTIRPVYEASSN